MAVFNEPRSGRRQRAVFAIQHLGERVVPDEGCRIGTRHTYIVRDRLGLIQKVYHSPSIVRIDTAGIEVLLLPWNAVLIWAGIDSLRH